MADRNRAKDPLPLDAVTVTDAIETVLTEPVLDPSPAVSDAPKSVDPVVSQSSPTIAGSSSFLPALGGGALAALLGFGLSHFNVLNLQPPAPDLSALTSRLSTAEASLNSAQDSLASLQKLAPAPAEPDPDLQDRLAALETAVITPPAMLELDTLTSRMDRLEARLAEIAAMPSDGAGNSAAALSALQADIRALKAAGPTNGEALTALVDDTVAQLNAAKAEAMKLTAEAANVAQTSRQSTALAQLWSALDNGGAYGGALASLEGVEIPPALTDHAATGLPTLASLQASFPDAARRALEAALRANMGESWTSRISTFLRSQTGARSLTPREGNDPDAILSRAEASLAKADLAGALAEIETLPPEAVTAMTEWTALADRRRLAEMALADLAATVGQ
jgi:hypothetical protein